MKNDLGASSSSSESESDPAFFLRSPVTPAPGLTCLGTSPAGMLAGFRDTESGINIFLDEVDAELKEDAADILEGNAFLGVGRRDKRVEVFLAPRNFLIWGPEASSLESSSSWPKSLRDGNMILRNRKKKCHEVILRRVIRREVNFKLASTHLTGPFLFFTGGFTGISAFSDAFAAGIDSRSSFSSIKSFLEPELDLDKDGRVEKKETLAEDIPVTKIERDELLQTVRVIDP